MNLKINVRYDQFDKTYFHGFISVEMRMSLNIDKND